MEPTILDRLIADAVNFLALGVGFGLLASVMVAGILNGIPSVRRLVVPGRDAINIAAEWIARMRQMDRDPDSPYQMSSEDKQLFARITVGLCIRNGLVMLGTLYLIAELSTGGM